ncbi:helix-turn-helix domain-containing protein [Qipengyuania sediminis]|uniref:helix-turn-helix domain-containing protein n=1 Tax=Qipengyuania sediminis TaxID=1532023 RepID=UPI0019810194|nr:helix-turn-helix domain-containing protein [Qipengyuania sediminis]
MAESALAVTKYARDGLRLRLIAAPDDLAPYVAGCYRTEVADGVTVEDWLPPEEGNLRVGSGADYVAGIGQDPVRAVPQAILSGPTDRATYLRITGGRFWGIGLTPAGWCRILRCPASEHANRFADTRATPIPGALTELLERLAGIEDLGEAAAAINRTLRGLLGETPPHEPLIDRVHRGLVSEAGLGVAGHAAAAGMNLRTFGRFTCKHFGFPPSVLLRRQRFVRSLARYAVDPSMKWIASLDSGYHDQAHFIHEFRSVMGMTPSAYAARPHPIVTAAVSVIRAQADVALQALYHPRIRNRAPVA